MITCIVNPVAGNGRARRIAEALKQDAAGRKLKTRFVETEWAGHAEELTRLALHEGDCTGIVSIGGDGTALETARGLDGHRVPLGVIPAGTGNDFIKTAGLPQDPLQVWEIILQGRHQSVDAASINGKLFLNACGTGFDVRVLDCAEAYKKRYQGLTPYLMGLIRAIASYEPVHIRCTADGQTFERDVLVCAVCNGGVIGGGIPICPRADMQDGKLDLVLVENVPRASIPRYLPGLLRGKVLGFGITSHQLVEKVEILSPGMRLQTDGEIQPMDRAEIEIRPAQLELFLPQGGIKKES